LRLIWFEKGVLMSPESAAITVPAINQEPHLATTEIHFGRILVATDFSEPANEALRSAISISHLFGSKLSLVHASSPVVYGIDTGPVPIEILDADLEADRQQMDKLVSKEPGLSGLKPDVTVAYADALDLIGRISRETKADLIVVGSHGASGLERLALGSVAEAVLRQSTCPVLIVGPNCKAQQNPFRSILFATDLNTTGLRGAQYAAGLAERFHAKLTFLHVVAGKPKPPDAELEVIEDRIKHQLQRLLPADVERYCRAEVRLGFGTAAEVIASVAHTECASLVVVGLKERALADHAPWSTLSHVIREINCAVLGVRGHLA
jgi:nucleotide-binding universal stress UspA family protein